MTPAQPTDCHHHGEANADMIGAKSRSAILRRRPFGFVLPEDDVFDDAGANNCVSFRCCTCHSKYEVIWTRSSPPLPAWPEFEPLSEAPPPPPPEPRPPWPPLAPAPEG